MKRFSELSEQEIIALAISSEDDDARAYSGFANALMETYPASAKVFMEMAEEEHQHRRWLTDLYRKKFGDFIPLIRRSEINGFVKHKPAWMIGPGTSAGGVKYRENTEHRHARAVSSLPAPSM